MGERRCERPCPRNGIWLPFATGIAGPNLRIPYAQCSPKGIGNWIHLWEFITSSGTIAPSVLLLGTVVHLLQYPLLRHVLATGEAINRAPRVPQVQSVMVFPGTMGNLKIAHKSARKASFGVDGEAMQYAVR